MKKEKRGFGPQEENTGSPKDLKSILDEDDLDEEIIDLEDIIEMGFEEEDEGDDGRPGLRDEILDADGDIDLSDLDTELDGRDEDLLEEDLLKEFSFGEEFAAKERDKDHPGVFEDMKEKGFSKGFALEGEEEGAPSDLISDLDLLAEEKDEFEKLLQMESLETAAAPEVKKPFDVHGETGLVASPEEPKQEGEEPSGGPQVEDLIDQIESRLIQTIREMVESRLPEIVRDLLREEIEKLKTEIS